MRDLFRFCCQMRRCDEVSSFIGNDRGGIADYGHVGQTG